MSKQKKGSYFSKHIERTGGERVTALSLTRALTDEERIDFESGKTLLIDKDLHWTSFDVVRKIRNAIRIKKVGHAGTLDPLATGLLLLCTGKHTKKINELMGMPKEYTGSFTLGATTPTYDLESEPENFRETSGIDVDKIHDTAKSFLGETMQRPPVYSAIKKDGVAAYTLARRGTEVELQPRPIIIYEFEITAIEMPVINFRVVCGTGTYIRSLANDFGQKLGCGAYLSALRRTKIGDFRVEDAVTVNLFMEQLNAV